jgi:hypothetical protein
MAENCEKSTAFAMQLQDAEAQAGPRMRRNHAADRAVAPNAIQGRCRGLEKESRIPAFAGMTEERLSRAFGGDDLAGEGEALAAAGLAALGAVGAGRAGRAGAGRSADLTFANRITDADDHGDRFYR